MSNFLNLVRTVFKLSHTQSVPKANSSAINIPIVSSTDYIYTAPSAGYVCVYYKGVSENSGVFLGHSSGSIKSTTAMSSIVAAKDAYEAAWIRVRKGDSVLIWANFDNSTEGYARFLPDEGA